MSFRKAAKLFGKIVESAEVKEDNRHEEDGSALERVRRRNNGHIEEETRLVVCDFSHQVDRISEYNSFRNKDRIREGDAQHPSTVELGG